MGYTKIGVIALLAIFISACTNKPAPPKSNVVSTRILSLNNGKTIEVFTEHAINGDVIEDTDNVLNLVTKTDRTKAIGATALQFGVSLLFGGQTKTFTKEQLKGNHIDLVKNKTVDYINPQLDVLLNDLNINTIQPNKISIEPYKFKLIYGDRDDKYDFIYSFSIKINDYYQRCSSNDLISSDTSKNIEEWENNNYELTQVIAKKIVDNCFEKMKVRAEREKLEKAINGKSKI